MRVSTEICIKCKFCRENCLDSIGTLQVRSALVLRNRMHAMSDGLPNAHTLGDELVASLEEAVAISNGIEPARVHLAPGIVDVRALRAKLGLSRELFAQKYGLKATAIRDWEQGLRRPDPAAQTLLKVIERNPKAVEEAILA
jgi:putative transcriptional regulator